ncbi:MAG: DUF1178 family protein [Alphaproteobacteria bacterium]|nr:DUF1178 family protein [Alphaproteobacteria bacterium]
MISFNLICSKGHEFGGWFPNSDSFETQVKKKLVPCPDCGDTKVSKSIMAPTVAAKSTVKEKRKADTAKLRKMLGEVRDHVEKNFDDVGDEFPEEARRIYYGETEPRDIYGNASDEEAEDLADEGVPVGRLPWLKRPNS